MSGGCGSTTDPGGERQVAVMGLYKSAKCCFCQDITIALDGSGNASITGANMMAVPVLMCLTQAIRQQLTRIFYLFQMFGDNNVYLIITDVYGKN